MDKYEYKLRLEEIRTLNRKGRFQEAAQVADTIDWNKVRNVSTLGVISDVYKINRRFDDAKAILLLANEKSPQNRRIVYALCDLTVKMGQVVDAVEYYKEFVQLAPNDNSKYILLYKIYEAQDISLEERIAVLKEYKKREYNEKWAYELAFLYHRVGLATECVEECDQLILWFGEGKYVAKAMELKMLYAPLSPAQQQAYDRYLSKREGRDTGRQEPDEKNTVPASDKGSEAKEEKAPVKDGEMDIQVKPMDMGQYNTMNLQAALAESMKEVLGSEQEEPAGKHTPVLDAAQDGEVPGSVTRTIETDRIREAAEAVRTVAADTQTSGTDRAESESRPGERRITGQMSLEEVLAEWEKLKKDNQTKRKQETRQWMQQQTGALFEDFDHTAREGILEKLEREEPLPLEQEKEKGLEDTGSFDSLDEVEELEEIEVPEEETQIPSGESLQKERPSAAGEPQTQPAPVPAPEGPIPANAAARVAMAAQGILEETRPEPESGETPDPEEKDDVSKEPSAKGTEKTPREASLGDTASLHTRIREQQMEEHERSLTKKEKALFAPFVPTKKAMRQLVRAMDQISLSAYTGNMIVTGAPGSDMMKFTQNVIRRQQSCDGNFSGKVAKISAELLNHRKADAIVEKIPNGALIVEKAGKLSDAGAENLMKALNQEHTGAVVFLLDTRKAIGRLTDRCPQLLPFFTARFDIAALDSATLVKYGCQYAYNMEYSIDELGRLALHTRIEDMQTSDHAVTVEEVREIVDEAIGHAERKSLRHFMDVLLRKRYDEDDMIILRERDFI